MKPFSVLLAIVTLGVALSAVAWVTKRGPVEDESEAKAAPDVAAEDVNVNPFEFPPTGPYPKAVLENGTHEFGTMELGEVKRHTYTIKNEGDAPLKLKKGLVQCKCTIPELKNDLVEPGESVEIELTWEPKSLGEFHQKAIIHTNDPENKEVELHVKGSVEQLALLSPQGVWMLDRIEENETVEFTGYIMSRHLDTFEVVGYEASSELVTCEFEPISGQVKDRKDVKSGYAVNCKVKGGMPVGRFTASLTINTDMKGGQDFDIQLEGVRPGPFSIIGENWIGSKMLVAMGDVKQAQGKTIKLSMFVSREDEPLECEVISSDPPFIDFTVEKDESFDVPAREKYWIIFSVPPDAELGSWVGDNAGTIVVKTNRNNMDQFEVYADVTVRE
ncbi:MAG: DUF1573 domain-containing protein [Planctomycetaceae bacterium]|nr:DUF1573 domain-containing protein [Planctomycetaceae bacterium]